MLMFLQEVVIQTKHNFFIFNKMPKQELSKSYCKTKQNSFNHITSLNCNGNPLINTASSLLAVTQKHKTTHILCFIRIKHDWTLEDFSGRLKSLISKIS